MRLIDADKVKDYIMTEGICCDTSADKEYVAEELLQMFPTVEAIPVEWIEKHYLKADPSLYTVEDRVIENMLVDWKTGQQEKENEQRQDS